MSDTNEVTKAALKKTDLIAVIKDNSGITQDKLERKLKKNFEFIPEFLGYLVAMYVKSGKIGVDAEGGMSIKEQGQVRTEPRDMYKVNEAGDGFDKQVLAVGDKLPEFWSLAQKTAIKLAQKEAYAAYKARCAVLDAMVVAEPEKEAA